MLSLPLYTFLIIYFLALLIIFLFIFINIGHIFQGGSLTITSLVFTIFTLTLITITLFGTFLLLRSTDWTQSVTVFDSSWFSGFGTSQF